jgi:16S rRNA (cytidine1402-2'-O)-methyltransferase
MAARDSADEQALAPGLYVVATPIGNLEDITLRALRVLKSADLIACEDTRHTQKLLNHYGVQRPTISYHEHNEGERAAELGERLRQGTRIALVSDAGTPAVSDPGYRVVRAAIAAGVPVFTVPGPAAFTAALAASGLPSDSFRFNGFLPAKSGQRRTALDVIRNSGATEIFYEAPHRLRDTLADIVHILSPERPLALARELTKVHEEFLRGSAGEVMRVLEQRGEIKGEIVLLIGKAVAAAPQASAESSIQQQMAALLREGMDEKSAMKKLAKELGLSRDEVFRELQRTSGSKKYDLRSKK